MFGGISFRYTGLAPVYLQTVGRFILSDQDSDHMLGAGISYAIFEHQSRWNLSRLYFTLEGAWQYEKEEDLLTTRLGGGLAFGGELVFSLGGIPLGLNVEVGQGFGREKDDSQSKGLAGVYVRNGHTCLFFKRLASNPIIVVGFCCADTCASHSSQVGFCPSVRTMRGTLPPI